MKNKRSSSKLKVSIIEEDSILKDKSYIELVKTNAFSKGFLFGIKGFEENKTILLEKLNSINGKYDKLSAKLYDNKDYEKKYAELDFQIYDDIRSTFFELITGEPDFFKFYDRFNSPGCNDGLKPVAWEKRFIPDEINDLIMDSDSSLKKRLKSINRLYKKCKDLEKKFKK